MKLRIFSILILFLLPLSVQAADTWYPGAQGITILWDAPTTYDDGTLLPVGAITYKVYVKNGKTGDVTLYGDTKNLTMIALITTKGWWRFGVQAVLGEDVSAIAWSDTASDCRDGNTFGLKNVSIGSPRELAIPFQ